jgi:hypothetical protein
MEDQMSTPQNPPRTVALPDRITFDMVSQALVALGLSRSTDKVAVSIDGDEVVVTIKPAMGGRLVRTYEVNGYETRFAPRGLA